MDKRKRRQLEGAGWKVGSTTDFLHLSDEQAALVEIKLGLASAVRKQRNKRRTRGLAHAPGNRTGAP